MQSDKTYPYKAIIDYNCTIIDDFGQHWILTFAPGLISIKCSPCEHLFQFECPPEEHFITTKTADKPFVGWRIYTCNIATSMFTLSITTKDLSINNQLIRESCDGHNIGRITITTKCSKISFILPYSVATALVNIASGSIESVNVNENT